MSRGEILTKHFDGTVNEILTEVGIKSRFIDDGNAYHSYDAVWDTGATSSCVSPKIVEEMGLSPISKTSVYGVGSSQGKDSLVYLVDFKLSNGMVVKDVRVIGIEVGKTDVLIGMDVISRGNFAIFRDEQGDMNMSFELAG